MKNTDLHTHTYYSDGQISPTELVILAKKKRVKNLALTDHNSVNGIAEAIKVGSKIGVRIIPSVEVVVKGGEILGYFIDYKKKGLKKALKKYSMRENKKAMIQLRILDKKKIINLKDFFKEYPHSKGNYRKGNLLNYLISIKKINHKKALEIINNIKIKEKIKEEISAFEGIKLIKKYGGIPVLAHPWVSKGELEFNEDLIKKLVKIGLKGIELDNGEKYNFGRTKEFVKKLKKIAKKYNLILTQGSDYHGETLASFKNCHILGGFNCDERTLKKLEVLRG